MEITKINQDFKTRCLFHVHLLILILVQISHAQLEPVLPPLPLPSDSEQIHTVVRSLSDALQTNDLRKIQGVLEFIPLAVSMKKVSPSVEQNVSSVDILDLTIEGNRATALCALKGCDGSPVGDGVISLEKVGVSWRLRESPDLLKLLTPLHPDKETIGFRSTSSVDPGEGVASEGSQSTVLMPATLRYSEKVLANIKHPMSVSSDDVYLLSWNYTYYVKQKDLGQTVFSTDAELDVEGLYYNTNQDDGTVFYLDDIWRRIVIARYGSLKSYGDKAGDYEFRKPLGMTIDIHGNLFVADADGHCIVHLQYTGGQLQYVSSITVPGILKPIDVAIDQSGSLSTSSPNPNADVIWVADDFAGQLVRRSPRSLALRETTKE